MTVRDFIKHYDWNRTDENVKICVCDVCEGPCTWYGTLDDEKMSIESVLDLFGDYYMGEFFITTDKETNMIELNIAAWAHLPLNGRPIV